MNRHLERYNLSDDREDKPEYCHTKGCQTWAVDSCTVCEANACDKHLDVFGRCPTCAQPGDVVRPEHKSLTQPTVIGIVDYGWRHTDGADVPTLAIVVDRSVADRTRTYLVAHGVAATRIETSDWDEQSRHHVEDVYGCWERGIVALYVPVSDMPHQCMVQIQRKYGEPLKEGDFNDRLWDLPEVPEEDLIEP